MLDVAPNPEDAVGALRAGAHQLVLLHTANAVQWLPMLRSNQPDARFVLLAHPAQNTAETTHPWEVANDTLQAPLERWLREPVPQGTSAGPVAPEVPLSPSLDRCPWLLLSLDREGGLVRAYGWSLFTGQPLEQAVGNGWLAMLAEPDRWTRVVLEGKHAQLSMGIFHARTGRHEVCFIRSVKTGGWTLHIEIRDRDSGHRAEVRRLQEQLTTSRTRTAAQSNTIRRLEHKLFAAREQVRRLTLELQHSNEVLDRFATTVDHELCALARVQTHSLQVVPTALAPLVQRVWREVDLESLWPPPTAKLEVPTVASDPVLLEQVVRILFEQVLTGSSHPPVVRVTSRADVAWDVITVTEPGQEARQEPSALEAFARSVAEGRSLGASLVRCAVRRLGGEIGASLSEGGRIGVSISLPRPSDGVQVHPKGGPG